jgi:DNA-binding CsgD family transcriptional regulator
MSAVSDQPLDRIHQLWDELADYGAVRSEQALLHALQGMAELVDAQQAYWLCTVRMGDRSDPVFGWRPAAIRYLRPEPTAPKRFAEHRKQIESGEIDPSILANMRGVGQFRINFQKQMVDPEWYDSPFHRIYFEPRGIHDVAYVATPVSEDVECWFGLQRIGAGRQDFGPAERAVLEYASRALKWFHRPIVLHHGLTLAEKPLTPTERRVLTALLAGGSESAIAAELDLTATTIHTYATRIFRKFNVKGRAGLTALWLQYAPRKSATSGASNVTTTR